MCWLTKSVEELEWLKPNSKDLTYKSNIDRYIMQSKQLEAYCLADYAAKIDPNKKKYSHQHT